MRVVVVGPLPPPVHGAARITAATVEALRRSGADLTVFDTAAGGGARTYHARRILCHVWAAARIATFRRVSAVYVGGAGGLGLWYQSLVVAASRLRRVPVVFHHHSSQYLDSPSAAMAALTMLGGRNVTHVTLSQGMSDTLRARYSRVGETMWLSNSAFLDVSPRPGGRSSGASIVLGHLSNLSHAKGLTAVLDTFEALLDKGLDVELRLAGPAHARRDQELIQASLARFPSRINYAGALAAADATAFLGGLDLFLFPSRYRHEAEPLVVLEAAAAGVPTIAYAVGSLPEIIATTGGWLVPVEGSFTEVVEQAIATLQRVGPVALREKVHSDLRQFHADNQQSLLRLVSMLMESR